MWAMLLGVVAGVVAAFVQPIIGIVLFALVVLGALVFRPGLSLTGITGRITLGLPLVAAGAGGWLLTVFCLGFVGKRTPAPPAAVIRALAVDSSHLTILSAADRSIVVAYAESLTYADSSASHHPPDRYHGEWDKNLLDTLGTVGLVEPEVNVHRNWKRDLSWGQGRAELKITIVPAPMRPPAAVNYGGISFYPGVTYVWVDSLIMANRDSGTARALYIPVNPSFPMQRRLINVLRGYVWNRAVARWSPAQCWSCVKYDWCQ